jgi:hypothetical protein
VKETRIENKRMKKQELPSSSELSAGTNVAALNRYYVQPVTTQVFLIRECLSLDGKPGLDDRLVRAFDIRHDAEIYAHSGNEKQRQLDAQHGHWVQRAL